LDIYWAEISQVFKLTSMFGPVVPAGSEKASLLTSNCLQFLAKDQEMAMFVEDFVMDAYSIQLREDVVPAFWRYFSQSDEELDGNNMESFNTFCRAVKHLHANIQSLTVPGLSELGRLRQHCSLTNRSVYGQTDLKSLFKVLLAGSLLSQLPDGWENLVTKFYTQAFTVFCSRESACGQPRGDQSIDHEDSSEWSDLTCPGCGQQTDQTTDIQCLCQSIVDDFQDVIRKLGDLGLVSRLSDHVVSEIVRTRICSHVEETCRGSFDCSYIASLENWLDRVVVAWLRSHPGQRQRALDKRDKLRGVLYQTYTKARIEQLFNIIIEFPDSQPALEDLRDCLQTQPELRSHLTSSLRQVLDAKLLHPGVATADILTAYIHAIRALRVLDGSGVILDLVCENVRRYLKTREDTVRSIVQALMDEATELSEEITKSCGLQLDQSFQDDSELLEDWQDWQPDPVDADPNKNHGRKPADIISMLVNIYGSKELFVNEYRSLLSNRLLTHCVGYNTEKEIRHLELLKIRFGDVSLHQCEVMLKDIGDSKRINSHLHSVDGGCPELQTQAFPVNGLILSAQFWPQFKAESLELPNEVAEALDVYTKAFQTLKGNRTLVWKNHLGFANIDLEIGDKKINLTVPPIQAAIIYMFQESDQWTVQELSSSLKVPVSTLRRKITFWQGQGILVESSTSPDTFSLVDPGEQGAGKAGIVRGGPVDVGGIGGSIEEDQEDSVTASIADQREEELGMFWSYITGMLTNLESLPLERIHQMLKIFAMQGQVECDMQELRSFLDTKVRQHKLAFSGGQYRLPK